MSISTAVALVLALLSTTITNLAYLLQEEPVPSGAFGGVRVLAFAAVTAGAFLLARPEMRPAADRRAGRAG